jgi:ribulose-5-phosphate 4-epimerase/fuculose-1-phosphate aldolase
MTMQELATATDDTFSFRGRFDSRTTEWLSAGLKEQMVHHGHRFEADPDSGVRFVVNLINAEQPQAYRRKAQATFVMSIAELPEPPEDVIRSGYPLLVRSLSNLVLLLVHTGDGLEAHFLTLEQGHYVVHHREGHDAEFFAELYERIHPLASSELVINNTFTTDLEEELWKGDSITAEIQEAGRQLDAMNLLPAPFPIHDILEPRDLRHVYRLYGIGGLSYGNLSARKDADRFWMSASGVNKGNLTTIGQDILMVTDFDEANRAIVLSVPPNIEPKRVSVDAIEHWMVYREHPEIGAIVHVHAWMEGIPATEMNYPCGTREIAVAVADLLREEPDPANAVIGLRNHGVTVTGRTMTEILERIQGQIIPQVPMS